VFKRAKTFYALDRAATVTGQFTTYLLYFIFSLTIKVHTYKQGFFSGGTRRNGVPEPI
jgi:hypothetical protein